MNKSKVNKMNADEQTEVFAGHSLHFLTSILYEIFNNVTENICI